jgi:hypothetical protein
MFCPLITHLDQSPPKPTNDKNYVVPATAHSAAAAHDNAQTTTQPVSRRTICRRHARHILHLLSQQEDAFLNKAIIQVENQHTALAKADTNSPQ